MRFVAASMMFLICAVSIAGENPLSNADVIALVNAGLNDDVVIAKVRQAAERQLDLSTDGIMALKKSGVSQRVIEAMLVAQTETHTDNNDTGLADMMRMAQLYSSVELVASDGTHAIEQTRGSVSHTRAPFTDLQWINLPGAHAAVRTHDPLPALRVRSVNAPVMYTLASLKSNPNDRSVKIQSGWRRRGSSQPTSLDDSWKIAISSRQEQPGLWLLQPTEPLKPGEYGLSNGRFGFFDFGVDPPATDSKTRAH